MRVDIKISENQFDFILGRSIIEAIYLIHRLMEFYRNRKRNLYMVFIDLEKAHDRVPREVLWRCLEKKGVPVAYMQLLNTCVIE